MTKITSKGKGFTLIELVIVITILAIVSLGVTNFISSGAQIFVDATERTQLLSESRFVVERLNREVRNALPNSLRVTENASNTRHCLEFVPVVWSTFYFDIPVAPEPANDEIDVVEWDEYVYDSAHQVIVYPTSTNDVYTSTGKRYVIESAPMVNLNKATITLDSAQQFSTDSPSSRLYVVAEPVSYCVGTNGEINRFDGYGFNNPQNADLTGGVLMAENIINDLSSTAGSVQSDPFRVNEASLTRNASVLTLLRFERGNESVVFNNEVHIPNVP